MAKWLSIGIGILTTIGTCAIGEFFNWLLAMGRGGQGGSFPLKNLILIIIIIIKYHEIKPLAFVFDQKLSKIIWRN